MGDMKFSRLVPQIVMENRILFFTIKTNSFSEAHRVRVFNNAGVHLFDIGEEESGDGQLMRPCGLAINKFNHLIVCNALNKGCRFSHLMANLSRR